MTERFNKLKDFIRGVSRKNVAAHAASCAYYMFLSLVPFAALAASLLPYSGLTLAELTGLAAPYIPAEMQDIFAVIAEDIYLASDAVLPISVLTALWLSSRASSALIRGMEVICGDEHYAPYLRRGLLACVYTLGLLAALALAAGMTVLLGKNRLLRLFAAFLLLSLGFTAVYRGVPGMKPGFKELLPGAVSAAAVWLLFTSLWSVYIRSGSHSTYGSLAGIAISLLWMYWCLYIILLGAYLNVRIYNSRHGGNAAPIC